MSDIKKTIKISDYYKNIDIPKKCFDNKNLRNLLELSAINNIPIFSYNRNKKIKVKDKKKIINDCRKLKKIKLKEFTQELSEYNTNGNDIDSLFLEGQNKKYINNIKSIDNIIKIINTKDDFKYLDEMLTEKNKDDYIEVYSNI